MSLAGRKICYSVTNITPARGQKPHQPQAAKQKKGTAYVSFVGRRNGRRNEKVQHRSARHATSLQSLFSLLRGENCISCTFPLEDENAPTSNGGTKKRGTTCHSGGGFTRTRKQPAENETRAGTTKVFASNSTYPLSPVIEIIFNY